MFDDVPDIRTMAGSDLPRLMWAHDVEKITLDTIRCRWREPSTWMFKPFGGLWTSPVAPHPDHGDEEMWSQWLDLPFINYGGYRKQAGYLSEIVPDPDAQVAWIASVYDFLAVYSVYPADANRHANAVGIDWAAVGNDFDAVYVGDWNAELRTQVLISTFVRDHLPAGKMALLGEFDCNTVWWSKPTFSLGDTRPCVPRINRE